MMRYNLAFIQNIAKNVRQYSIVNNVKSLFDLKPNYIQFDNNHNFNNVMPKKIHKKFIDQYFKQIGRRKFSSKISPVDLCWNCKKIHQPTEMAQILCKHCGSIQEVNQKDVSIL